MSSIAYTTDQEMIEYHRLCGNRDVNFWRLSARAGFTDFKRGDLLFFYAYGQSSKRKKGFVGYAHFHSTSRLSLNEMWKRYGTANGYSSKERLKEAIEMSSRSGTVPETMNCLHLKDCVYFSSPVYPNEAGLKINEKLESFTYIGPGPLVKSGPDFQVCRHGFVVFPDKAYICGMAVQIISALSVTGKDLYAGEIGIAQQISQGSFVYPFNGEEPAGTIRIHACGFGRLFGRLFRDREKLRSFVGLRRFGDQKRIVFQRDQQLQTVILVEMPRLAVRPEGQIVDRDRAPGTADAHFLF